METLNIQCIEQQQVLITLTLTDSNGALVDLTQYAVYAASVGAVDPYCRRAARLEWAAAINNECSAFIITAPGHDIARAPWKYQICIKNRQLGLEWAVVSGRVELTPRACGTDGISPAAYTVACEATPSGLVNVTLDATVGSISTTLEQVKASAAAAAAAAQNAHADAEDSETAATKAAQAALAAAADAKVASDKATAAEAAATAAPEACAPYVQQTQQAAAAALEASRTATAAAAEAQASADAAAPAQGYATRAESAQAAAVQATADAATAATTATEQADAATAQAESARLAATTASTASDNAQAAATRADNAATRAEAATPAAARAEAARDAAETAAATATTAAADVPGLVARAETAATSSEAAKTAAETAQSNAETAATTATQQAEAAAASAAQADTDARACAIYDQRVSANKAASDEAVETAQASAEAAASSAADAAASAQSLRDEELLRMVDLAAAAYGLIEMGVCSANYLSPAWDGKNRIYLDTTGTAKLAEIIVSNNANYNPSSWSGMAKVVYIPKSTIIKSVLGTSPFASKGKRYLHAPSIKELGGFISWENDIELFFSPETKFDYLKGGWECFAGCDSSNKIHLVDGITFANVTESFKFMAESTCFVTLPDTITFENAVNLSQCFTNCSNLERLPASINFAKLKNANSMFCGCYKLEIDDIIRVCNTLQDLQALETPTTGPLGLPSKCRHNGDTVDNTINYLNANHPDFLTTLAAKGWTVTFA